MPIQANGEIDENLTLANISCYTVCLLLLLLAETDLHT